MPLGAPKTWVNGVLPAADLNVEVRDQFTGYVFETTTGSSAETSYAPTHTGWTISGTWAGFYRTRGKRISIHTAFTFSATPAAYPAGPSFTVTLPVAAGTRSYSRLTAYLTWGNRPAVAFVTPGGTSAFCMFVSTPASFPTAGQIFYLTGEYESA